MRLQFGRASALLEGDAEAPSEHQMAEAARSGPSLQLGPDTLLKVGHHGSRTSTTPEFLPSPPRRTPSSPSAARTPSAIPAPRSSPASPPPTPASIRTDEFGLTTFLLSRDGRISDSTGASNP